MFSKKKQDIYLLDDIINESGIDFMKYCSEEKNIDKFNKMEFGFFIIGFTFACYCIVKRNVDKKAMSSIVDMTIDAMLKGDFIEKHPNSSIKEQNEYCNNKFELLQKRQMEYLNLLLNEVKEKNRPGKMPFLSIAQKVSKDVLETEESDFLILACLIAKHFSKVQKVFQNL